jgi:hypothetical protein
MEMKIGGSGESEIEWLKGESDRWLLGRNSLRVKN